MFAQRECRGKPREPCRRQVWRAIVQADGGFRVALRLLARQITDGELLSIQHRNQRCPFADPSNCCKLV